MVVSGVAALLSGSVVGLVMGMLSLPEAPQVRVTMSTPSPHESAAPTVTRSSTSASSSSPTAKLKTITQREAPPPPAYIDQPWTERNLRFVSLDDIWRDDQGQITLKVTPMTFLTGAKARAYSQQHLGQPRDYAAMPSGGAQMTYRVRDDATIFGEFFIGDHTQPHQRQVNRDELFDLARKALDFRQHPTFWLQRSMGVEGPVIYLAEQYLG
jgi:hypothetical protein